MALTWTAEETPNQLPLMKIADICANRFNDEFITNKAKSLKDIGNELYKQGQFSDAIQSYQDALFLYGSWQTIAPFLSTCWHKYPIESVSRRLGDNRDLLVLIAKYVNYDYIHEFSYSSSRKIILQTKDGSGRKPEAYIRYPHQGASICAGNIAQCKLSMHKILYGNGNKVPNIHAEWELLLSARNWAKLSQKLMPESEKSFMRQSACWELMRKSAMYKTLPPAAQNAVSQMLDETREDLKNFKSVVQTFHISFMEGEVIAARMLGWIQPEQFEAVYSKLTTTSALQAVAQLKSKLDLSISLVPFCGGQTLTINMTALPSTILGLRKKDYQNVSIIVLDPDSGNDLEKPPHGWPSGLCLRNLWTQLLIFFNEAKSLNVHIQSLMLGQGLVGRKALVDKFFAKNGISVFLRESISTNASESGNLTIPIENDTQLNILVRQGYPLSIARWMAEPWSIDEAVMARAEAFLSAQPGMGEDDVRGGRLLDYPEVLAQLTAIIEEAN